MDHNEQTLYISVDDYLCFYTRVIDGLEPISTWTFEEIYQTLKNISYFKNLISMGKITVCYDGKNFIDFEPSPLDFNRHQIIALSTFVNKQQSNSRIHIKCRHEFSGHFEAIFESVSPNEIMYTNTNGKVIRFCFDSSQQSQID